MYIRRFQIELSIQFNIRYSKAKASATSDKTQQQLGLSQGNFGPKYEAHVAQLQQELEELRKRIQVMQRQEAEIR